MSNNFLEFIYGKDRIEKEEKLKKSLFEIESKYIEFFKKRPAKFEGEEHDRLHNHWLMWGDNNILRFGFDKESDLPVHIQKECLNSFNEIFNSNNRA
jgi:hypothetical protein